MLFTATEKYLLRLAYLRWMRCPIAKIRGILDNLP